MKPESVSVPFPMSKRLKFEEVDPVSQAKTNKQPPVPLPSPLIPPLDRWSGKEVLRQLRNRRRRRKRANANRKQPQRFSICVCGKKKRRRRVVCGVGDGWWSWVKSYQRKNCLKLRERGGKQCAVSDWGKLQNIPRLHELVPARLRNMSESSFKISCIL